MNTSRKLTRSITNRMIAGVCGGIAEYFDLDPTLVRVAYVLLSVISAGFPGLLVYIVLWVIVPEEL
jgi:phage shock protein C